MQLRQRGPSSSKGAPSLRACSEKALAPPFLELHDAVIQRAGKPILAIGELRLEEGEHIAVLGPNGSGKSSFVSLISREALPLYREEPPVLFRGRALARLDEVRRSIGIVSSSMQDQIRVHLPAVDVVAGGLYATLGLPFPAIAQRQSREARERAEEAMGLLGIGELAGRDVMSLSTGQVRRALIARALVHDPDALVFDEPCTGLDPEGMHYVRSTMRLLAQAGKGIVLVTHYPEDVIPEIKRVLVLKEGRVYADGTKRELLTSEVLSAVFEAPLRVKRIVCGPEGREGTGILPALTGDGAPVEEDEYFSLVSTY